MARRTEPEPTRAPFFEPRRNTDIVTVIARATDQPATPRQVCLVVIYGQDLGKKHALAPGQLIIGRSSTADLQVDEDSISRHHCKLVNTGGSVLVQDLGSTNGTYVNDRPVAERVLADGDLVKVGSTIFKFLSGDNIESAYHDEVYRLTTTDGLTQAYNKRYFLETLDREVSRARRYGRPLSLVMFDVDRFKRVNDTYGHLAGDHVLRRLAETVRARLRREDMMARYGGEEFAIVLPEIDRPAALALGEEVRALVESTCFAFQGTEIPITISVGVASIDPGDEEEGIDDLVARVDARLYEAKNGGRNRVAG